MVRMNKGHENFNYWNKVIGSPSKKYAEWFKAEEIYLMKHIPQNSRILEVGCGEGRSLSYLTNRGCMLYGVDYDMNAGLLGRKRLESEGMFANILYGEATDLIFKDSTFDYVLSCTTPANFGSQTKNIYSEMQRVLKPSGEIIINVFNEDAFEERIKFYSALNAPIKEIRGTTVIFEDKKREFVSQQFSRKQLEDLCERNNLLPVDITKASIGYLCRFKKK
jgi:ubiquinone/menaquinone biosynthesis C-methylase UbiE